MKRGLKSVVTSLLLTCFVLLALAQVARPLRQICLDPQDGWSVPHSRLTRHIALEAPAVSTDLKPPYDLGGDVIESNSAWADTHAPARAYAFIPLGPFWTGRILRRIAAAEPDGH